MGFEACGIQFPFANGDKRFVCGIGGAVFGFVCQQVVTGRGNWFAKSGLPVLSGYIFARAGLSCFRFLSRKRINFIMLFSWYALFLLMGSCH